MRTGYIIVNKKRINYTDDDKTITFSDGKVIGAKTSLMDAAASYKQATIPVVIKPLIDYKITWPTTKLKIMATSARSTEDNSTVTYPVNGNIKVKASGSNIVLTSDKRIQLPNDAILPVGENTINSNDFPGGLNVKALFEAASQLAQSVLSFGTSTTSQNVLNWTSVLYATNYLVKRSLNSDMSASTTIYSGPLLTFTDTGLSAGTTYYYQVTASAAVGYTSSISAIASKATSVAVTTYELTINVTGLDDTYEVLVNGELWVAHKKAFAIGTVLTDLVPSVDGFTLSPASVGSVTMDANKSLDFTATPVSSGLLNAYSLANPTLSDNDEPISLSGLVYTIPDADTAYLGRDTGALIGLNSKIAFKYTALTKGLKVGVGRDTDYAKDLDVFFDFDNSGNLLIGGRTETSIALTTPPTAGQYLMLQRLSLTNDSGVSTWRFGVTNDGVTFLSSQDRTFTNYADNIDGSNKSVFGVVMNFGIGNELNAPQYKL